MKSKVIRCTQCNVVIANSGNTTCDPCYDVTHLGSRSIPWRATENLLNLLANFLKGDIVWDADQDEQYFPDFLARMRTLNVIKRSDKRA